MMTSHKLADQLNAQLEKEYRALVEGDLSALETAAQDKLAILEAVARLPHTQLSPFRQLRGKLERNQRLMHSAIRGMRSAIDRARAVHVAATSLRTYSASGKQTDLPMTEGRNLSARS